MIYCIKCGEKAEDGMKFCPRCGAPLPEMSEKDSRRRRGIFFRAGCEGQ